MMQLRKLQLQHAADAAALGAAYEKARGNTDWQAAGYADATLNGFTNGVNGVTITIQNPPTSGTYSGNTSAFQATITQNVHTAFLPFLGIRIASPSAMSVAKGSATPGCVYVMESNASSYPLNINSTSSLTSACGVYVNSTNKSVEVTNGTSLSVTNSASILVQGSSSGSSISGTVSPSPTYGSAAQSDPLANVTSPAFSSCKYYNTVVGNWLLGWLFPTYATLNPGTYCGGLTTYYSYITLNPGLYIFTGGATLSNTQFTGSGVTFYSTVGGGWGTYTNFIMQNVTFSVSAPTDTSGGGVTGIVFFGDRNWVGHGSQGLQITNSTINGDGIWYVLNTGISLNASSMTATNYLGLVTDSIALSQTPVTIPTPNYSSLTGGAPYAGGSGGCGVVE